MRQIIVRAGAALSFAAVALAACDNDSKRSDACIDITLPGMVIQVPGLDVAIRDSLGRGQALGTTVVVRPATGAPDSAVSTGRDTVHVLAGFAAAGTYGVTVHKPFYRDATFPSVSVNAGECAGAITANVPVTLRLVAGAPPVRSVGILGGEVFLVLPTDTATLTAVVDADPGLTTVVTWHSADTTLAMVASSGLVSARCSRVGGTDTVTAVSVADTAVRAKRLVVVAKQPSCP